MLEEEMKVKCEFLVERKELSKIIDPHVSRKCLAWGSAPHGVTSADTEMPAPKTKRELVTNPAARKAFLHCLQTWVYSSSCPKPCDLHLHTQASSVDNTPFEAGHFWDVFDIPLSSLHTTGPK